MKRFLFLAAAAAWASLACTSAAQADASPSPADFAFGMTLNTERGRPLQELLLPDAVYSIVSSTSLADLRVFNAAGQVVPYALCVQPRPVPQRVDSRSLPLFPIQQGLTPVQALGTHIELQTSGGTHVEVTEPKAEGETVAAPIVDGFIADARAIEDPLQAVNLDWTAANGASELAVSIEASDDLDRWQTVVARGTLLKAGAGEQTLERARLPLPEARYSFLRITALDAEGALQLRGITAEAVVRHERIAQLWFAAAVTTAPEADSFYYDSSHRAPLDSARISLPDTNMSLRLSLASRDDSRDPWLTRWTGEVYSVGEAADQLVSPAARFASTQDRYWRLQVVRGAETLAGRQPNLQLGYTPARLRFLTQGNGPYLLAYGSGRVSGTPQDCDSLLSGMPGKDMDKLIGKARAEPSHLLGGAEVLKIPPKPTPKRQIVLWAVLIVGTLLLAGMAFSLLKKLRQGS